ncbi:MAG: hypothetical protein HC853_11105 [Anaerolineae bacterium]|nr:hypothetical protein [Anaerolineae bacterium]
MGSLIKSIEPHSVAAAAGLMAGDEVRAINGHVLMDVIDAQFYGADDDLTLALRAMVWRTWCMCSVRLGKRWALRLNTPRLTSTFAVATTCARFALCCKTRPRCAARCISKMMTTATRFCLGIT